MEISSDTRSSFEISSSYLFWNIFFWITSENGVEKNLVATRFWIVLKKSSEIVSGKSFKIFSKKNRISVVISRIFFYIISLRIPLKFLLKWQCKFSKTGIPFFLESPPKCLHESLLKSPGIYVRTSLITLSINHPEILLKASGSFGKLLELSENSSTNIFGKCHSENSSINFSRNSSGNHFALFLQ